MSSQDKYSRIMHVHVEHEYYENSWVPAELIPAKRVVDYFRKNDMLLKRVDNSWYLYANDRTVKFLREDFPYIPFVIKPLSDMFYFVSGGIEKDDKAFFLSDDAHEPIQKIDISAAQTETTIKFKTVHKYFEYIVFPKNIGWEKGISIIDAKRMVEFTPAETKPWENGEKVFRFVSKNKIKLTEKSPYNFNIIEKSTYGERVILHNIRHPAPQSASIYDPRKNITAFYTI